MVERNAVYLIPSRTRWGQYKPSNSTAQYTVKEKLQVLGSSGESVKSTHMQFGGVWDEHGAVLGRSVSDEGDMISSVKDKRISPELPYHIEMVMVHKDEETH
eukprot:GFYU01010896.1.p2 GENE.GFYU01010896.1~~GFYU01010896.1.p2  ORF type:complete len:102 (-),score=28.46 GFYU01010896.1:28-333(-)